MTAPLVRRIPTALTALIAVLDVVGVNLPHAAPYPVGAARILDFSWLAAIHTELVIIAVLGGVGMTMARGGWRALAAWALAATHVAVFTCWNSQGFVHHGHQLLSQVLLAMAVMASIDAVRPTPSASAAEAHAARVVIAAAYFGAGLRKLLETGGAWIVDSHLLAVDALKTAHQHALDRGQELTAAPPAVAMILTHPDLARVFFDLGLVLEVAAPLALLGRAPSISIGLLLWGMHRGIDGIFGLTFPGNEAMLLCWLVLAAILAGPVRLPTLEALRSRQSRRKRSMD